MIRTGWEIYYNDLTVYTNASGVWGLAPASGVLIVVECFDDGHKIAHMGSDYYYMDPMPSGNINTYLEIDKNNYTQLPTSGIKIGNWSNQTIWSQVHTNVFGA